jgi:hypothetical protein
MLSRGKVTPTRQRRHAGRLCDIGGWADIKVLQKYLHPTDAQRRAAVESIGATTAH